MPSEKDVKIAGYGTWKSPITPEAVAAVPRYLYETSQDEAGNVYFVEPRAGEKGRFVIVRINSDGHRCDVTPPNFNARSRVHEYGGGSYVLGENSIYFVNFKDQGIYSQAVDDDIPGEPHLLVHDSSVLYADLVFDKFRKRIICVREDHTSREAESQNAIAAVDAAGITGERILISGNDFYSSPRMSRDGRSLAWLTWNHPGMPFFGTELWTCRLLDDGSVADSRMMAGGESESISEPLWSNDGVMHFVSDRSGWWNLYSFSEGNIQCLHQTEAEFAPPQWLMGMSSWAFADDGSIVCTFTRGGIWHLGVIDAGSHSMREVKSRYTQFSYISAGHNCAFFVAGSHDMPVSLLRFDLKTDEFTTLYSADGAYGLSDRYLSAPEHLDFPTSEGKMAHGFFYAPKNGDYAAPPDELPPLIVISHGGPTSATRTSISPDIQYWTSRGFAVLDVNYGGSTGYGREYRMRLNGSWGIVDVDDCVNGALFLAEHGKVDRNKLLIRGQSAGGYTTLSALAFRNVFAAGASYFGVSDLELLVRDTHKFESRYLDSLIGPYPERRDLYVARSPINRAADMFTPVIFLQGLEDRIVPPNQAELMFNILKNKGIFTAYVAFEGEQHGFRQAANIKKAYEAELYFYSRVLGFDSGGSAVQVRIENMQ